MCTVMEVEKHGDKISEDKDTEEDKGILMAKLTVIGDRQYIGYLKRHLNEEHPKTKGHSWSTR
jgi:hypothetical protein